MNCRVKKEFSQRMRGRHGGDAQWRDFKPICREPYVRSEAKARQAECEIRAAVACAAQQVPARCRPESRVRSVIHEARYVTAQRRVARNRRFLPHEPFDGVRVLSVLAAPSNHVARKTAARATQRAMRTTKNASV